MCRFVGWVSATPVTLQQVLGDAGTARFNHLSSVHADGWGAAWHDRDGRLRTLRSTEQASVDERFASLARTTATTAGFVHIRLGTPGYGSGEVNSHPFTDGPWAFAHNGAITPNTRIDRLLGDGHRRPEGITDSERYFLALREHMDAGASVPAATGAVLARMRDADLTASSLNAMLLGPDALHVVSEFDSSREETGIPLWPADELASGSTPPYFPISYRADAELAVAASSGIVTDTRGWHSIPNHAVLRVDRATRATGITSVTTAGAQGAAARTGPQDSGRTPGGDPR